MFSPNGILAGVVKKQMGGAFDAMRDKLTGDGGPKSGEPYTPKLTIRTKSEYPQITIEIEDNGPGVPDEIKNKIPCSRFLRPRKGHRERA